MALWWCNLDPYEDMRGYEREFFPAALPMDFAGTAWISVGRFASCQARSQRLPERETKAREGRGQWGFRFGLDKSPGGCMMFILNIVWFGFD